MVRKRRRWRWLVGALAAALVFAAAGAVGTHLIDEPLRERLESTLNQRLTGYTARLPGLDLHPLGFALTLHGLEVRQNAHPEPPVIVIESLHAGVHWRALLHLRLVADFALDGPRLHINRPQLLHEADDKVQLKDKGWQEALEAIYPLKINQLRVTNGGLTYVDDDPRHPLEITQATFAATNIRNVRSPGETYPSPIHLDAVVFDHGRLRVDGDANFLAVPQASVRADVDLSNVPLQRLKAVAAHANVQVSGGTLAELAGRIEYASPIEDVRLRRVRIDDVAVDYVHSSQTATEESHRIEQVKETAAQLADRPTVSAKIDTLTVHNATLGYVDQTRTPGYRIFLSAANVEVHGLSNQSGAGPAGITLTGSFMGTGQTHLETSFLPRRRNPQIDIAVQIEQTQMPAMNDFIRTYGNFDVVAGSFSFYSQLHMKDGQIDGYVKPLFTDMHVYDRRQDSDKALFQQMYEALVGGVGGLLENRSKAVATQTTISGNAESPHLSTWEIVVNLVRNAFFKTILPGFDRAVSDANTRGGDSAGDQRQR